MKYNILSFFTGIWATILSIGLWNHFNNDIQIAVIIIFGGILFVFWFVNLTYDC
ncbi:MAG: hypothetical protein WC438_06115 [Candidatus Pacearchaeota archaeon]